MKSKMLFPVLFSLLLLLSSCPKEPMWYAIFVSNPRKLEKLKMFIHQDYPGDSLLPVDKDKFNINLETFHNEYPSSFRTCIHKVRGIRDCIESQPEKKIYMFIFDADTLAAYDYNVIRERKMYKDRVEIPYTMATNDADLKIDYPQ
jgi:hypothetical protein